MKFDFTPAQDVKACMTKTDIAKFEKSTRKHAHAAHYKQWAKDVIHIFAQHLDITFAQGVQLVKFGDFSKCRPIHERMLRKIPHQIDGILEDGARGKVPNPFYQKILGYTEMTRENHVGMVKTQFVRALSLRHPDDKVPAGFPKRNDEVLVNARKIINRMHIDETRHAHQQRTVAALRAFFNGSNPDTVNDLTMERIRNEFKSAAE